MDNWQTRTKLVHGGTRRSHYNEVSEAIFLTQGFVYESAEQAEARFIETGPDEFIYARYGNPTVRMFEQRMALLEGAEDAFATASGMAAVNGTLMSLLKAGDHLVSAKALFGSCLFILEDILMNMGVEVTFVDGTDLNQWRSALSKNTKVCFFETISNPTLEVIDICGVAEIAHSVGATLVVDNVFSTPIFSNAIDQGADVVIYSATKHIDGQGRALGGIVLGKKDYIRDALQTYMKHTGGSLSPFNAWIMLKGLETLDLRVRTQVETARKIAELVEGHSALSRTLYPGLKSHPQHTLVQDQLNGSGGTVLCLDVRGGKDAAFEFLNSLKTVLISNNLGDAKSIATHPATTTHQRLDPQQKKELGISNSLIRLSIGLEDSADLIKDVDQALTRSQLI